MLYTPARPVDVCGKRFGAPIVGAAGPTLMESLPTADQPDIATSDRLPACNMQCNLWTAATANERHEHGPKTDLLSGDRSAEEECIGELKHRK
jgi:hypothetical protein